MSVAKGDVVPRDAREIYDRGLEFLLESQSDNSELSVAQIGGHHGAGTHGLVLLAMLASGEDPNYGPYSSAIRKLVRKIITSQSASTGYIGPRMYDHGFAMLALCEAYGVVREADLWEGERRDNSRTVAEALELAVRCAITSQKKNPYGAWRYSPDARDADTSVSGAILVGLLAARNAGVEVPDESIDKAIKYFTTMTGDSGSVAYSGVGGFGNSLARSSIACLVFSIAKRKDLKEYKATKRYVTTNLNEKGSHGEYTHYYHSQALFQADVEVWQKWNRRLIRELKSSQNPDGSFNSGNGPVVDTSMALLALALNFKFLPIYER